jgi:RNase H-fold protein (predicted Holliday junction resolvase)
LPRIIAIDYGLKRTGIAVTDPLQIIATGLTTVETSRLFQFFELGNNAVNAVSFNRNVRQRQALFEQ